MSASILLPEKVEMKKTREGFGRALVDLGEQDPRIVVLVGDLTESTMVSFFAERFPDRFIQVGIAEQNMACVAAGLAAMGKVPFFATYGAFASCRAGDQIRPLIGKRFKLEQYGEAIATAAGFRGVRAIKTLFEMQY